MEVRVDANAMEAMVAKAMFDGFTQEQRDQMVTGAIQQLLSTPSSQYDKTPAIARIFREQAEYAARKIALDRLQNDEAFKAGVERLFADAAKRCFEDADQRENIVSALADGIRKAVTGDRY